MAVISCSFSPEEVRQAGDVIKKLNDGGVPAFIAPERGALALKNALDYYNSRNNAGSL